MYLPRAQATSPRAMYVQLGLLYSLRTAEHCYAGVLISAALGRGLGVLEVLHQAQITHGRTNLSSLCTGHWRRHSGVFRPCQPHGPVSGRATHAPQCRGVSAAVRARSPGQPRRGRWWVWSWPGGKGLCRGVCGCLQPAAFDPAALENTHKALRSALAARISLLILLPCTVHL